MAVDFTMYSGDTKSLSIAITDSAGDAVDVSTATDITYKIIDEDGTVKATKTLAAGVSVSTSTVTVTLAASDTASLAGIYSHELQITDATSSVSTAMRGHVTIQTDLIT